MLQSYFRNFFKFRYLLSELVVRDVKVKYKRSVLGLLWSVLNPLFMMIITTIVFSNLFRFDITNFPVYLLSGQVIFAFFSEATNVAMIAVLSNAQMIKKIYVPKYIFPVSKSLSAFVNLGFSLPTLFFIILFTGQPLTWHMLLFPIPIVLMLIFSIGIGLILSTYAVFFRDIVHLYGVLLTALNYLTPIFYPLKIIPEKFQLFILFNPLYYYVELFRDVVYYGVTPELGTLSICMILSLLSLALGFYVFHRNRDKFILYI
ncbi:ABC transporter permease [Paenibacillus sp. DMB5]|uniref:ABC transporter permease n=1 Tax=Paenibacillus sp. DMB5 TaxID=1780103 RepID=UPI00076D735F|nr:ABC transporter permease [Paenibacillus sp. DMB5]KUP23922.1 ABC transporter [Paenibacillus sp. DMB5]